MRNGSGNLPENLSKQAGAASHIYIYIHQKRSELTPQVFARKPGICAIAVTYADCMDGSVDSRAHKILAKTNYRESTKRKQLNHKHRVLDTHKYV